MDLTFLLLRLALLMALSLTLAMLMRGRRRKADRLANDVQTLMDFHLGDHRVECSWCGLELKAGREPVSHGICPDCAKEHFQVTLKPEARR